MNSRLRALGAKASPLTVICVLATMIAASAASSYSSGSFDLTSISGAIGVIINLATGPVAKLIAIGCILGGAAGMAQGQEGHETLKKLGIIAFVIGILITSVNLMNAAGSGATI